MRTLMRLLAALVLAPLALVAVLVITAAAIAGLPLLWQALIRAYTAPPKQE